MQEGKKLLDNNCSIPDKHHRYYPISIYPKIMKWKPRFLPLKVVTRHPNTPTGVLSQKSSREPSCSYPPSGNAHHLHCQWRLHSSLEFYSHPAEMRCPSPSFLDYCQRRHRKESGLSMLLSIA